MPRHMHRKEYHHFSIIEMAIHIHDSMPHLRLQSLHRNHAIDPLSLGKSARSEVLVLDDIKDLPIHWCSSI